MSETEVAAGKQLLEQLEVFSSDLVKKERKEKQTKIDGLKRKLASLSINPQTESTAPQSTHLGRRSAAGQIGSRGRCASERLTCPTRPKPGWG